MSVAVVRRLSVQLGTEVLHRLSPASKDNVGADGAADKRWHDQDAAKISVFQGEIEPAMTAKCAQAIKSGPSDGFYFEIGRGNRNQYPES